MEINFGKGDESEDKDKPLENMKKRVWKGENGSRIEMISGAGTKEQFKREQEKAREKLLPELEEAVQKMLKDYAGGGLIILKTAYDKDLNPKGAHMAQLGVDGPAGMATQVMALLHGASHILDLLAQALSEEQFKELLESISEENGVKVVKNVAKQAKDNESPFKDMKGDPFRPDGKKGDAPRPKRGGKPLFSKDDGKGEDIDDLKDLLNKMF